MANNDGKIYIILTNQTNGEGSSLLNSSKQVDKTEQNNNASLIRHQFYNFVESQAKSIANYTLANIGNFTGDFNVQREVNNNLQIIGILGNIATATILGAKYGPVGALSGFVIATASTAVNFGLQERSNMFANKQMNHDIGMLREISGLDNLTNGGRI